MDIKSISIELPNNTNVVVGTAHFIKTVEDIFEAMINSVPGIRFGLAFCEGSGKRLIRIDGTDDELRESAKTNMLQLGCGHSFILLLRNAYPINILNSLKNVPEVCTIHAATSNPLEIIIVESEQGRGIIGVIDGYKPEGVENDEETNMRKELLRKLGYKK